MKKGIGTKIGFTLIPLLLVSFVILQFVIVGEFKKSSQIQSENNLNLFNMDTLPSRAYGINSLLSL
ncbi:MAG: hypothetical protein EOM49_08770 [Epsilonproteobacteria bacterium]|nr:hypothetical protein [Campylobacterota bacterium]